MIFTTTKNEMMKAPHKLPCCGCVRGGCVVDSVVNWPRVHASRCIYLSSTAGNFLLVAISSSNPLLCCYTIFPTPEGGQYQTHNKRHYIGLLQGFEDEDLQGEWISATTEAGGR